jgi:two-component system, cell cycle sensor histidine kinase and response regulator CckA
LGASEAARRGEHAEREDAGTDWLRQLPAPAAVFGPDGELRRWNDDAASLLGVKSGRPASPVRPGSRWFDRVRAEVKASGRARTFISRHTAAGRTALEVRCSALPGDEFLLLLRDCTAQVVRRCQRRSGERHLRGVLDRLRQAEEKLRRSEAQLRHAQKMDVVGRLAAGIAHDFNNLLAAIQGHAQFLLEDLPESSSAYEDATEIRRAADRATELTRQLLTFARREPARVLPVNLNAVVTDVEKLLRRLLRADIELETELHPDLPTTLADRGQLEQVIVNMVVNARDAMEHGGAITIRTAFMHFDAVYTARGLNLPAGGYVVLAISDNGKGMSPELQEQIFEPFFTTKEQGTGLGLPTVSGIVQQSGGYMSLYSEEDVGTTFKVFLPLAEEDAPVPADLGDGSGIDADDGAPAAGTVLVVDDDEGLLDMATRTLRAAGYSVIAAESGDAALQLARAEADSLAVVVTDMMMPEMTGEQLVEKITAECPTAGVVLMSGFPEASLLLGSHVKGAHHFLEKPFTRSTLLSAVRSAAEDARG